MNDGITRRVPSREESRVHHMKDRARFEAFAQVDDLLVTDGNLSFDRQKQKYLATVKVLESVADIDYPWNPHWRPLP